MRRQAFTIAAFFLCVQATLAAPDLSVQLNLLEAKVTGKCQPNLSLSERVAALEKTVHGQVKTGSLVKRVKELSTLTGGSASANMMPPEAPRLDSSAATPPAVQKPHVASKTKNPSHPAAGKTPTATHAVGKAKTPEPLLKASVEDDIRLGMQHHRAGRLPEAEQVFRNVLRVEPKNPHANYNLGVIYETQGELPAALAHYKATVESTPGDADALDAIAAVERKMGVTPSVGATAGIDYPAPTASGAPVTAPPYNSSAFPALPGYQSGPFYAPNANTPLLQGNAQQADLASTADQTSAALSQAGGVPATGLQSGSTALSSGAARPTHALRRRLLNTAVSTGLSAATRMSGSGGLARVMMSGGSHAIGCPLCQWINRF